MMEFGAEFLAFLTAVLGFGGLWAFKKKSCSGAQLSESQSLAQTFQRVATNLFSDTRTFAAARGYR
jgi:hypothetical protein